MSSLLYYLVMKVRGFTVVELLIVVAVIAILATITLVSFNGVQNSAKNVQFLVAIDTYEKALMQYRLKHKSYPPTGVLGVSSSAVCLGEYGARPPFTENQCSLFRSSEGDVLPPTITDPEINALLREYLSALPSADTDIISLYVGDLSPQITNVEIHRRGISYIADAQNAKTATLSYTIKGDEVCGRGEKTVLSDSGITMTTCNLKLE